MNKLLICGLAALCLHAQTEVMISEMPPPRGATNLYFYDASDRVEYICTAASARPSVSLGVTQIVDAANTATVTTAAAHGLAVNNSVTIAGVTGDTDLNGTYRILTVPSTTTFTVTSASVTDATYNTAGITLATAAPRSDSAAWAIKKYTYNAAGKISAEQWAVKSGNPTSSPSTQHICDNRATLSYQ
jgi:hypothetical protein